MARSFKGVRRGHRAGRFGPVVERMEERVLFSFVVDPTSTTISASAGAGGSFQQITTNPAHAQDSSSFAGNSYQSAYAKSASANASYQTAPLQLTLHGDIAESDNSSYPTAEGQATITLNFSLTAAASVQVDATLAGTGGGGANFDLDSFSLGDFPISASSSGTPSVHRALNLSAGNYAVDLSAGSNFGDTNATASIDLTLTIGTAKPPQIISANTVTFQVGKPSAFTVRTTGDPTPAITETAFLPAGITFVDNGDGTATLSGTPEPLDATGNYDLIFTASNGVALDATHPNANQFFTLVLSNSAVKQPLPPTHLVFGSQPAITTTAGATLPPVTVLVEDKTSHVVTTDGSLVSLTLAGTAGGVLNGTTAVQAVNGVATFSDLSMTKAGTYTLTSSDGALRPARSRSFKITADSSTAHLVLSQSLPATARSAKPLPPISATLEDQYGNIVKNSKTAATLSVVSGPAGEAIKGRTSVPFLNGVASFRSLRLSPAGAYTLQLADGALPGSGAAPSILSIVLS